MEYEVNTVTLIIRKSTNDHSMSIHRAFKRPMEAIRCVKELNDITDKENLPAIWYTYTLVLE